MEKSPEVTGHGVARADGGVVVWLSAGGRPEGGLMRLDAAREFAQNILDVTKEEGHGG
jgi:hypothetical protein